VRDLPSLRNDLDVIPVATGDAKVYHIKDPVSGELFEFSEEEYFLLNCLDGRTTDDEIIECFREKFDVNVSEKELRKFITNLQEWGLLDDAPYSDFDHEVGVTRPEAGVTESSNGVLAPQDFSDTTHDQFAYQRGGRGKGRPYWRILKSHRLFAGLARWLHPFRYLVYLVPIALIIAIASVAVNAF
jgi:hypothetical protein